MDIFFKWPMDGPWMGHGGAMEGPWRGHGGALEGPINILGVDLLTLFCKLDHFMIVNIFSVALKRSTLQKDYLISFKKFAPDTE